MKHSRSKVCDKLGRNEDTFHRPLFPILCMILRFVITSVFRFSNPTTLQTTVFPGRPLCSPLLF